MAKNWAIVVGINKYNPNNFARLKYAKRDAELMRDFFCEAKFDEVYYFADDSPDLVRTDGAEIPTYPSCGNLLSFLHDRFERPFLSAGDNLWFFFAGHGGRYGDRDYLMPIDANPRGSEPTAAILVSDVRDRLCRCGADNVILILDACRNEGSRDGQGVGNEHQQGVITISACSPTQKSWEIDELQQGAFTYALLEALQISGERNCATVERLDQYLRFRVPELCRQYGKFPEQNPRISADPATKLHFILLPQYATLTDVAVLKNDAYRSSQVDNNLELAEQLWIRIIAATYGRDMEALETYRSISQRREGQVSSSGQSHSANEGSGGRATIDPSPIVEAILEPEVAHSDPELGTFSSNDAVIELVTVHWAWLILSLISYGFCGLTLAALTINSFVVWTVASAVIMLLIGIEVLAGTQALAGIGNIVLAGTGIVALAGDMSWTPILVMVVIAVAGIIAGGLSFERLIKFSSRFRAFLILIVTAGAGLGLGWFVNWVFSLRVA